MARLVFVLVLILGIAPAVLAGPACARKLQGDSSCITQCGKRWGWPGRTMGDDPWGNVMKVTVTDMASGSIATKQCKMRPSEAPTPVGNVASAAPAISAASTPATTQTPSPPAPSLTLVVASQSAASVNATSSTHDTTRPTPSARTQLASLPPSEAPRVSKTSLPPAPPASSPSVSPPPPSTKETPPPAPAPPPSSPPPPSTTSAQPQATPPPKSADTAAPGEINTSNGDIDAYLSAHNSVRAQHGASPLAWNDNLASKAQQWANGCKFQHSGGSLGPFGENLAAGTGSTYGIDTAIKSWTDEVSQYDPNNPQPSHFTQVVWKGSTQVGCAVQSCDGIFPASFGKAKYFVCEYQPQGNIIGAFAQNVQA